jgi:ATP-dependent protease ClpP protease subunit
MLSRPFLLAEIRSREEAVRLGNVVEETRAQVANCLKSAGFGTLEQVETWMDRETWMTSEEALAAGWVHEICDQLEVRQVAA